MERKLGSLAIGVAALLLSCGIASAQWLNLPLAGTPRNADGQPNLTAPAPKTSDGKPDLSGIWRAADGRLLGNLAANEPGGAPFQPWAAALYKERQDNLAKDRPSGRCLPHGVPDAMMVRSGPFKIAQTPGVVFILYEEFNHYRQVFTDGRGLPKITNPAWFGYSVGKWEGDMFVADTIGFNEKTELQGFRHTESLHMVEKFRRTDFDTIQYEATIEDPNVFEKPWTVTRTFTIRPDLKRIDEFICENNRDYKPLFGAKP